MGDLCSKSMKADKVFAKSDGHSDNHKSNGKNHKSTNMPSDLTSVGDHGVDKKKKEVVAAAGNGSDDFYDGIPWFSSNYFRQAIYENSLNQDRCLCWHIVYGIW